MKHLTSSEKYPWKDVPAGVMCWHIHHDLIVEISTEPLAERARYIRTYKSPREEPVRLEWMRPVKGKLPQEVCDAARKVFNTRKEYRYRDCCRCCNEYRQILKTFQKEIKALHDKECPGCPYDHTLGTLFPPSEE